MSKDQTKSITVNISYECWKELNILRYKDTYKNLNEVIKNILENYTNKIIKKENNISQ